MSEMLKTLSAYQSQALDKGIDFSISIYFNSNKVAYANVSASCCSAGENTESHMFSTTISEDYCTTKNRNRMEKISDFIQTVSLYTE